MPAEASSGYTVANTELPGGGTYVFRRLAERLVSYVLIVVKIVPGYDDFITVGMG
jgi:hypothetical protein